MASPASEWNLSMASYFDNMLHLDFLGSKLPSSFPKLRSQAVNMPTTLKFQNTTPKISRWSSMYVRHLINDANHSPYLFPAMICSVEYKTLCSEWEEIAFSNYNAKFSLTLPKLLITMRLPKKEQPKFHCHLFLTMEFSFQPVSSSYFRSAEVCLTCSCKYSMPPPPTPPPASRFLLLRNHLRETFTLHCYQSHP